MLERILLHSLATSILRPGSAKYKPSRKTGRGVSWKRTETTSVEAYCSAVMTLESSASGRGITNTRKLRGNRATLVAWRPKNVTKPPTQIVTTHKVVKARKSFELRPGRRYSP